MPIPLKYSTASQEVPLGHFLDSSDGDTEETGLTIANTDIKLWKAGATTLASKNSGGATHISNGIYYATLDATDTNTYGSLVIFVHVSGALAIRVECVVMNADAYDALYAADGTGHIEADVVQVSGDGTAADSLETACDNYSVTRGLSGTALPAAAADAAGGLTVSDAGGLDLDAKLANTNEITAARMGALTDWINGGRLDLILDIIAGDVAGLDGAAMRGTDSAALAATALSTATWTEARAAVLSDLIDGGRLDLLIDAIVLDVAGLDGAAMRGTDSAALAATALSTATWTEARAGALTDWINGGRLDLILDIIAGDVAGLDGAAMRGTDGANTTTPLSAAQTESEVNDALVAFFTSAAQLVDDIWDEILTGSTHNIPTSAGRRVRELTTVVVSSGTAQGAGVNSNQIQLAADAPSVSDIFDPAMILLSAGTGAFQSRRIIEYDGATKIATVNRTWKTIPDNTTEYLIMADPGGLHVNEGLARGGGPSTVTLNALASADDDAYLHQTIFLVSGTGEDQARIVSSYDGTTKVATVNRAWDTQPDTTTGYLVLPSLSCSSVEWIMGDAQSATDLKDFVDAGYDTATNQIEGVKLVDVTTANTDMRGTDSAALAATALSTATWTEARAEVLSDLIDGGRLDLLIDAIVLDVAGLDGASMRGTDGANTTIPLTAAQVNAEVSDVLKTDTISEMAQGIPPTTPTIEQALMYLYMAIRNRLDVTSSSMEFRNDAGTVVWKKSLSDDGTTYSETKGASGP